MNDERNLLPKKIINRDNTLHLTYIQTKHRTKNGRNPKKATQISTK